MPKSCARRRAVAALVERRVGRPRCVDVLDHMDGDEIVDVARPQIGEERRHPGRRRGRRCWQRPRSREVGLEHLVVVVVLLLAPAAATRAGEQRPSGRPGRNGLSSSTSPRPPERSHAHGQAVCCLAAECESRRRRSRCSTARTTPRTSIAPAAHRHRHVVAGAHRNVARERSPAQIPRRRRSRAGLSRPGLRRGGAVVPATRRRAERPATPRPRA